MNITPKSLIKIIILCSTILLVGAVSLVSIFAFEKTITNSVGMEFVLIPAGSFIMGSPLDELFRNASEIPHKVTISKPFYMQTTEVTVKQWRKVMGKKLISRKKGSDDMPVGRICWHDAMDFIKKLKRLNQGVYRLPTEAEWEYASRAGTTTAYSWGDTIDCSKAMYGNNPLKERECTIYNESMKLKPGRPAPVKSYPPNAWGLYDMHGNVWELCQDWFGDYDVNIRTDPVGPKSGTFRVRRGGSWFKYGYSCRSANRAYAHPSSRLKTTGFRLVREVQ